MPGISVLCGVIFHVQKIEEIEGKILNTCNCLSPVTMHLRGPQAGRESVCAEPTSIGELRSPGRDQGTSGIAPARKGAVVPGSVALIQAVSGLSQRPSSGVKTNLMVTQLSAQRAINLWLDLLLYSIFIKFTCACIHQTGCSYHRSGISNLT